MNARTTKDGMFLLDGASFMEHQSDCRRYDENSPATLALLCLDGAVLLKGECEKITKPRPVMPTDEHRVSKKVAQAAMRYK